MAPEILGGLVVMVATIIVLGLVIAVIKALLGLQAYLGSYIFHSNGSVLLRLLAVIPWLPLTVFSVLAMLVAALCTISLANDAKSWLTKK